MTSLDKPRKAEEAVMVLVICVFGFAWRRRRRQSRPVFSVLFGRRGGT